MSQATELIAQQMAAGASIANIWGSLMFNVKLYGAKGDGLTSDAIAIAAAITAASVAGGSVVFPSGTYVTDNLTIPSNVTLWFMNGAKLSINSGKTVTINGGVDAGLYQIFSGLGTVTGSIKNIEVYPQWWGAVGDGVVNDSASIVSAIAAVVAGGGGILHFPVGTYRISTNFTVPSSVTLSFNNGAKLSIDSTKIVTINGCIDSKQHQIFSGAGTVAGTIQNVEVYPQWWGAKNDGVTDATSAINAALAASMSVKIPQGTYSILGTILFVKNGQKLKGEGSYTTTLVAGTSNLPIISINNGLNWLEIAHLLLDRSVPAILNGNGIEARVLLSNTNIHDMIVQNQYTGLALGGTDYSVVKDMVIQNCYGDGIFMRNLSTYGICQWNLSNILLSANGSNGLAVRSVAGTSGMSVGKWMNINSFSNGICGISVAAVSSCPIYGVRISGGFLGADNNSEIILDTYGGKHTIDNMFLEQAGTQAAGRGYLIPASNIGSGIEISANNIDVLVTNCYIDVMSMDGITSSCTDLTVANCVLSNNGLALVGNYRNGVHVLAGKALITGCRMTLGQYGVHCYDGAALTLGMNDLSGNTTAPYLMIANALSLVSFGNRPTTVGTVIPGGGVLVGLGATGGMPAAGTINVQTDIKKNNVTFTNP